MEEVFPVSIAAFIAMAAAVDSVGSAAATAVGSPDTDASTEAAASAAGSVSGAGAGSPDTCASGAAAVSAGSGSATSAAGSASGAGAASLAVVSAASGSAAASAGSASGAAAGSPDTVASAESAASAAGSAGTGAVSTVTSVISSETSITGSETMISYLNSVGFWLISLDMLSEIRPAPADLAVMNPSSSISMISGVSLFQTERAGNSSPCSMRAVSCRVSPTDMLYFAVSSSCPASLLIALRTVSFSSLTDTDILAGTGSPDSDPASVSAAKAWAG